MAFTAYHNITGSTGVTVELTKPGDNTQGIKSIMLTNIHATATATISLFLQDDPPSGTATSTFKVLNTVAVPADSSLLLDDAPLLSFNGLTYGLYITVGASDTVDVLISR
jgi:hypothetical protein